MDQSEVEDYYCDNGNVHPNEVFASKIPRNIAYTTS